MINEKEAYTFKGIKLSLLEMKNIHDQYEYLYLKEYIEDNYKVDIDNIDEIVWEVLNIKNDALSNGYSYIEDTAIFMAGERLGYKIDAYEEDIEKE